MSFDRQSSAFPVLFAWLVGLVLSVTAAATELSPGAASLSGEKTSGSTTVATVNGIAITEAQVSEMLLQMLPASGFHKELPTEKKERFRRDAIEKLIEAELMYQAAAGLGIKVPDEQVAVALEGQKANFRSEKEFQTFLKKEGLTEAEYRKRIQRTMVLNAVVRQKVDEPSRVSDEEVRKYYDEHKAKFIEPEQIRLNEIFVYINPTLDEGTRSKKREAARDILDKARVGGDFCELAAEYSDDDLKDKCGDIGFAHKGMLDETIEKVAWDMKIGEVGSAALEKGVMIIKVGERRPEHQIPLDEVKDRLKRDLTEKKRKEIAGEFISGLKAKATIVVKEN